MTLRLTMRLTLQVIYANDLAIELRICLANGHANGHAMVTGQFAPPIPANRPVKRPATSLANVARSFARPDAPRNTSDGYILDFFGNWKIIDPLRSAARVAVHLFAKRAVLKAQNPKSGSRAWLFAWCDTPCELPHER